MKSLAFHGVREDFTSTVLSWALNTGQVVTQLAWEAQHVWGEEAGAEKGSPQLTVLGGAGPIQTLQGEDPFNHILHRFSLKPLATYLIFHVYVCVCVCTCISHMCLCVCPLPSSSLPERKFPKNRNCTYKLFCVQIYWRIACKVLNSLLLEISKHLFTQQTDNLTSVLVKSPKFPGSLRILMFNFIRRLSGGACLHTSGLGRGVIWVQTAWLLALLGGQLL